MNNLHIFVLIGLLFSSANADEKLTDIFLKLKLGVTPKHLLEIRPDVKVGTILEDEGEVPDLEQLFKASEDKSMKSISLMEKIDKDSLLWYSFTNNKLIACSLTFKPVVADAVPAVLVAAYGNLADASTYSDRGSISVEWKTEEGFIWYYISEESSRDNFAIQKLSPDTRTTVAKSKKLEELTKKQSEFLKTHFKTP